MRFLIVEDTPQIATSIAEHFRLQKHIVEIAPTIEEARLYLETGEFDLVILDINLPDGLGFDLLKWLRASGRNDAVIVLTARIAIDDKIDALDLGADDYLVKPYQISELEARLRAIMRRAKPEFSQMEAIGGIAIERQGQGVQIDGTPVALTKSEMRLLEIFLQNLERVFEKADLLNRIYHMDQDINENALELLISRLRKKIQDSQIEIKALRGLGYQARLKEA